MKPSRIVLAVVVIIAAIALAIPAFDITLPGILMNWGIIATVIVILICLAFFLEFEADDVLERLISSAEKQKAELADLLIARVAEAAGCEAAITFDKRASRIPFFHLLK